MGVAVRGVGNGGCELFIEGYCYLSVVSEMSVVESDWLVRCLGGFFPERFLRSVQKYLLLYLCEQLSTFCVQVSRFERAISSVMCWSRVCKSGSEGLIERSWSRCRMRCLVVSDKWG